MSPQMNREQMIAWLILDGWSPVMEDREGEKDSLNWRGLRKSNALLFTRTAANNIKTAYDYDYDEVGEVPAPWEEFTDEQLSIVVPFMQENPPNEP